MPASQEHFMTFYLKKGNGFYLLGELVMSPISYRKGNSLGPKIFLIFLSILLEPAMQCKWCKYVSLGRYVGWKHIHIGIHVCTYNICIANKACYPT